MKFRDNFLIRTHILKGKMGHHTKVGEGFADFLARALRAAIGGYCWARGAPICLQTRGPTILILRGKWTFKIDWNNKVINEKARYETLWPWFCGNAIRMAYVNEFVARSISLCQAWPFLPRDVQTKSKC